MAGQVAGRRCGRRFSFYRVVRARHMGCFGVFVARMSAKNNAYTGCFFRIGALVFDKVLSCEKRGPILRNRVLSGETLFHWMTMTMTMTHSEKSHIRRMKAWPYKQECRGHDPTKKNLLCWWSLLIGKVYKYKLLRTECNASSLEMNSKYKKNNKDMNHRLLLCWILKLNRRILGFGASPHEIRKKKGSQEGKTGQGNQEKQQHPERGRQDTTAQQSYLIHVPTFLSLVRRNSYTIPSSLLRTRHVFFWSLLVNHRKALNHCTAAAAWYVSSSCWHCIGSLTHQQSYSVKQCFSG